MSASELISQTTEASTLHNPSVIGREPQAVLCDVDVHLVCEVDSLEELVERPRRASNRPEEGRSGGRALCLHGDGFEVECQAQRDVCLGLRKIGFFQKLYGTDSARLLGILDVNSDRTEHVDHAEPRTRVSGADELEGRDVGLTYARAREAGTARTGRLTTDRSVWSTVSRAIQVQNTQQSHYRETYSE